MARLRFASCRIDLCFQIYNCIAAVLRIFCSQNLLVELFCVRLQDSQEASTDEKAAKRLDAPLCCRLFEFLLDWDFMRSRHAVMHVSDARLRR